jgi:hypothetical protein
LAWTHSVKIIELNRNLIDLPVGELLEHVFVFVVGRPPAGLVPLALLPRILILVHKVIVVAEVVFVNIDVAQCVCDGLLGRSLEVGQKGLESGYSSQPCPTMQTWLISSFSLNIPCCAW